VPPRAVAPALALSAALVVAALPPSVFALTGAEWQKLPPPARAAYVTGVVDAWVGLVTVQESLGNRDGGITVFADVVTCLRDRLIGSDRILSAVERYVADEPGLRTKDMPDIVYVAVGPLCR
jgi:hypothetical protein